MPVRFQVDPDFYDHPKTIGMSDAAISLWVRAGSFSAAKRLDGFVPLFATFDLSRTPAAAAQELVQRGFWRVVAGGYSFKGIGLSPSRPFGRVTSRGARPWIPNWIRRAVMTRDGHRCQECGATEDLSLDHVQPWSKGGTDTEENLRVLCGTCNRRKGAKI